MKKRSVKISGHDTSISLEASFLEALGEIADARGVSFNALVAEIDEHNTGNLSSALRVYVLNWYRSNAQDQQG